MNMRVSAVLPGIGVSHAFQIFCFWEDPVHQLLVDQYLRANVVDLLATDCPKRLLFESIRFVIGAPPQR